MGKVARRRYTADFKAKVALEAIRGELTLAELSAKHGIHQTMIAAWKKQAIEGMAGTFSGKAEAVQATSEAELARLHAKIGQLVIEKDFLSKAISRSAFYYEPTGKTPLNLALMRLIDEQFLETPFYGARQMARHLRRRGYVVGRKRVRRLMAKMGLAAIYQKPRTSAPHPAHRTYKYLLRHLTIDQPNHVWCVDITYIPMRRGFLYLVAIMDWATRKVLAWRLSNTMDAEFCIQALEEAVARFGVPEIFNTDQGSQFTSPRFTDVLKDAGVRISMDGRGRWMDNVFIERLWRSMKYECVYLHAFETGSELRAGLVKWVSYYNADRPHSGLGGRTPDEAYQTIEPTPLPGLAPATASKILAA